MLFNHWGAEDRLSVYQSSNPNSRGKLVGSSRNFSLQTAQEKQEFIKAGASSTYSKDATVGPSGDGFVYDMGKSFWNYNSDNGRYITTVLEKNPKNSTAYQYLMVYPIDKSQSSSAVGQYIQGPGIVPKNCQQPVPKTVAPPPVKKPKPVASGGFNWTMPSIAAVGSFGYGPNGNALSWNPGNLINLSAVHLLISKYRIK